MPSLHLLSHVDVSSGAVTALPPLPAPHRLKLRLSQASFLGCILGAVLAGLVLLRALYGDIHRTDSDHRLSFTPPHTRLPPSSIIAPSFDPGRASLPFSSNHHLSLLLEFPFRYDLNLLQDFVCRRSSHGSVFVQRPRPSHKGDVQPWSLLASARTASAAIIVAPSSRASFAPVHKSKLRLPPLSAATPLVLHGSLSSTACTPPGARRASSPALLSPCSAGTASAAIIVAPPPRASFAPVHKSRLRPPPLSAAPPLVLHGSLSSTARTPSGARRASSPAPLSPCSAGAVQASGVLFSSPSLFFGMAAARHAGAMSSGPHPRPFLQGAVCGCPLSVSSWTTALRR